MNRIPRENLEGFRHIPVWFGMEVDKSGKTDYIFNNYLDKNPYPNTWVPSMNPWLKEKAPDEPKVLPEDKRDEVEKYFKKYAKNREKSVVDKYVFDEYDRVHGILKMKLYLYFDTTDEERRFVTGGLPTVSVCGVNDHKDLPILYTPEGCEDYPVSVCATCGPNPEEIEGIHYYKILCVTTCCPDRLQPWTH